MIQNLEINTLSIFHEHEFHTINLRLRHHTFEHAYVYILYYYNLAIIISRNGTICYMKKLYDMERNN